MLLVVENKKAPEFSGAFRGVFSGTRCQYPLGELNSRKNRRENRRLLVKATHNQTHLAAFPIRDLLG